MMPCCFVVTAFAVDDNIEFLQLNLAVTFAVHMGSTILALNANTNDSNDVYKRAWEATHQHYRYSSLHRYLLQFWFGQRHGFLLLQRLF